MANEQRFADIGSLQDYWQGMPPEGTDDPADPFSHASGLGLFEAGLGLFEAAAHRLASAGIRCPELLFTEPRASSALVHGELGRTTSRSTVAASRY